MLTKKEHQDLEEIEERLRQGKSLADHRYYEDLKSRYGLQKGDK